MVLDLGEKVAIVRIRKGEIKQGRFLIPYRVYGDRDKMLVGVSGAMQTMAVWRAFVSFFVPEYSIVVFDFPGHGRAKILSGPPVVPLEEQIAVLRHVVDETHLSSELLHFAAASWGTIVAAGFAARYPSEVGKMVLGSFGVKPSKAMLDTITRGQQLVDENKGSEVGQMMIESFGQRISPSYKSKIIEQFHHMDKEQFLVIYAHCDFVRNARHISEFVDLRKIQAKTLIVNGEHDTILDLRDGDFAATQIPNCELKMIPDAGHFLHFEREDILNIYREFLAR